jgi:hypothetical protein
MNPQCAVFITIEANARRLVFCIDLSELSKCYILPD